MTSFMLCQKMFLDSKVWIEMFTEMHTRNVKELFTHRKKSPQRQEKEKK